MSVRTDSSPSVEATPVQRKPRLALFIATAGGLGYLPKAPGTWGSLAGLLLGVLPFWVVFGIAVGPMLLWKVISGEGVMFSSSSAPSDSFDGVFILQCLIALTVVAIGTWSAGRAATFWKVKDPQQVVIDEVSGQHLTLLIGCALPLWRGTAPAGQSQLPLGEISWNNPLSWKYLLLGFILFRVFDIWKPFPARQAEALPGGWGIMADDWVAGIYAAILLWGARALGL